jgi:hypothetical protein
MTMHPGVMTLQSVESPVGTSLLLLKTILHPQDYETNLVVISGT